MSKASVSFCYLLRIYLVRCMSGFIVKILSNITVIPMIMDVLQAFGIVHTCSHLTYVVYIKSNQTLR